MAKSKRRSPNAVPPRGAKRSGTSSRKDKEPSLIDLLILIFKKPVGAVLAIAVVLSTLWGGIDAGSKLGGAVVTLFTADEPKPLPLGGFDVILRTNAYALSAVYDVDSAPYVEASPDELRTPSAQCDSHSFDAWLKAHANRTRAVRPKAVDLEALSDEPIQLLTVDVTVSKLEMAPEAALLLSCGGGKGGGGEFIRTIALDVDLSMTGSRSVRAFEITPKGERKPIDSVALTLKKGDRVRLLFNTSISLSGRVFWHPTVQISVGGVPIPIPVLYRGDELIDSNLRNVNEMVYYQSMRAWKPR